MFLKYDGYLKMAAFNEANDKEKTEVAKTSGPDPKIVAAENDLARAASFIMGKYKFFAELIFKLKPVFTREVPTMATDGKRIFINPEFCATLTDKQVQFVVCHEILHNVMGHFSRMAGRDHELWNIATDLEINPFLVDELILKPASEGGNVANNKDELKNKIKGLYEDEFLGMSAEEIYDELSNRQPPKQQGGGGGDDDQGGGGDQDGDGDGNDDGQGGGGGQGQGNGQGKQGQGKGQGSGSGQGNGKPGKGQGGGGGKGKPMPKGDWTYGQVIPTKQGDKLDPDTKNGQGDGDGKGDGNKGIDGKGKGEGNGPGDKGEKGEGGGGKPDGNNSSAGTETGQGRVGVGEEGWTGQGASQKDKEAEDKIAKIGDVERLADKWKTMSEQAANMAGSKLGAGLRGMIMQNVKPAVNWKKELEKFVGAVFNEREATIPNRRFVHSGAYVYGMRKKAGNLGNVIVFVDTSGSMSNDQISQFLGEVSGIIDAKKPKKTDVCYFDTQITAVDTLKNTRKIFDIDKANSGGGGTMFGPCLKWVQENIIKKGDSVELVVFFTDGYNFDNFSASGKTGGHEIGLPRPPYFQKWIWVITDDTGRRISIPWGKRIDILTKQMK